MSNALRKIFAQRKSLSYMIQEQKLDPNVPSILTIDMQASRYPTRLFCSICGDEGSVSCLVCTDRVCGLKCKGIHDVLR